MNKRLQAHLLQDGRRLHLSDGPIDLIVAAWGEADQIAAAYQGARVCMEDLLDLLCKDLPVLRGHASGPALSRTGRRMQEAVAPFAKERLLTPMAAVAGAVAEEVLGAMTSTARLSRAYVNNGGDIAFYLAPGERFVLGAVDRPDRPALFSAATIASADRVRGVATSGWRGRSFSLGIADAVTVLAARAADADAAATIIANEVNLRRSDAITRVKASDIDPNSDLGERLVTRSVPKLSEADIAKALVGGAAMAQCLLRSGQIIAAALHLQGTTQVIEAGYLRAA